MPAQALHSQWRESHAAAAPSALWLLLYPALAIEAGDRTPDLKAAGIQVEVRPFQPQELTLPQPHRDGGTEALVACLGQYPDGAHYSQAAPCGLRPGGGVVGDQEIRSDLLRQEQGLRLTPVQSVSHALGQSQRPCWRRHLKPPFGERALNVIHPEGARRRRQNLIAHRGRNKDLLEDSLEEVDLVNPGEVYQRAR